MLRLRIVLISLILLTFIALAGAWSAQSANGAVNQWVALTPGMVARQQAACPWGASFEPGSFRVTTTRWIQGRAIVFYTARCRDGTNVPITLTGDVFTELTWAGWQMQSSSTEAGPGGPGQDPIEEFGMSHSFGANPYTMLHGRVGIPDVVLVEVVLDDGDVVQDRPTNGVFVAYIPRTVDAREIRLLDHTGQLLHQMDIAQPPIPPQPGVPPQSEPLP